MLTRKTAPDSRTLLRALVTVLFICALAGLVLTALLGFEEPNTILLFLSCGLLLMTVMAVFAHLCFTRLINRSEKRAWFHQLTGRRATRAWGEYLSCEDLHAAAVRFGEEASSQR